MAKTEPKDITNIIGDHQIDTVNSVGAVEKYNFQSDYWGYSGGYQEKLLIS